MTHLTMTRGDGFNFDIAVTDNGSPVNLTGLPITVVFKRDPSDTAALITKSTTTVGVTAPTVVGGNIARISLMPSDTSGFGRYQSTVLYWNAQVTVNSVPYTVDEGTLTVQVD